MGKKTLIDKMEDSDGCLPMILLAALITVCVTIVEIVRAINQC